MSKNPLLQTLIAMTGQDNVITVHRPFVKFTGSLEAAMMLSQLLYWTPRSKMGGWIAKSDKDWQQELCLTRYSHRKATQDLIEMGIIETQVRKFRGAPTTHYLILWETLENEWTSWLRSSENELSESTDSDDETSENGPSLTETTSETTEIDTPDTQVFRALENLMGALHGGVTKYVDVWLEKHPLEWIFKAIDMARDKGARSEKYVDKILIGWEANGYPKSREQQVAERRANGKAKVDFDQLFNEYAQENGL